MPIFRVKSVKIYTGKKKFTRTCPWRPWQISGMSDKSMQWSDFRTDKSEKNPYCGNPGHDGVKASGFMTSNAGIESKLFDKLKDCRMPQFISAFLPEDFYGLGQTKENKHQRQMSRLRCEKWKKVKERSGKGENRHNRFEKKRRFHIFISVTS